MTKLTSLAIVPEGTPTLERALVVAMTDVDPDGRGRWYAVNGQDVVSGEASLADRSVLGDDGTSTRPVLSLAPGRSVGLKMGATIPFQFEGTLVLTPNGARGSSDGPLVQFPGRPDVFHPATGQRRGRLVDPGERPGATG